MTFRNLAITLAALALLALSGCVVEPAHLVPDNYGGGWHSGWHHHDGGWR
jgi:hypothetical protein